MGNDAAVAAAPGNGHTEGHVGKQGKWARLHSNINHSADNFFYRLGYWVATHPKATVAVSLLLVVVCMFGFANFRAEDDGEDLWVPQNSRSMDQEDIVLEYYDDAGEYALLLMEAPDGGNLLTKEAMDALWELDALTKSIESDGNTFANLCSVELDGVTCEQPDRGVTRFWGSDFATYEAEVTSDADILAAVNLEFFPDGEEVGLEAIFGNSMTFDASGALTSAQAMIQTYGLQSTTTSSDPINDMVFKWQKVFQDTMEDEADKYDVFNLEYLTGRSLDDAFEESISGEIMLFVATFGIMIVIVVTALGRCCSGWVKRRTWLGLAGVGFVFAAGMAAYGLCSGFGVPFTALSQILPFILIGIGVDDMFVIVSAFDHTDPNLPVEERVALGVKRCGVSITYTSMTNFFAFMLGALTTLPAVEYFCIYAGVAILFDFFLQMTAFVACLTMDANRQKAGRLDWCCCCKSQSYLQREAMQRGVDLPTENDTGANAEVHQLTPVGRFLKEKYTPFILSGKGMAIVLFGTFALLAAGIYGSTQASQDFDQLDLVPDGHYSRSYASLAREYELEIDTQYIPLNVYTQEVDYPDTAVQAQIQDTDAKLVDTEFIEGPIDSWLTSFVTWAETSDDYSANVGTEGGYSVYTDRATFYTALAAFTADGENARFVGDIVYNDNNELEITRTGMFLVDITSTPNEVDALMDSRDVTEESTLVPEPFAFSGSFIFTEQFLVIYTELIVNFILALVAVAVLSMLVLGKVSIVVLVCVTICMIDIELLGFVYHWGLHVNSITVIELIMAVGLVVDYMVHIVHYYLHQDPSTPKSTRLADALGEIGPSVLLGASTTFIGIMPLAFASNAIFRTFFRMFLIIIGFGLYHGIVFMPVALSILPDCGTTKHPVTPNSDTKETTHGATAA